MKWNSVTALFLLLTLLATCRSEESEENEALTKTQIEKAIKEYEVESLDRLFSTLEGAEHFIDDFRLSVDEIEMVGDWHGTAYIKPDRLDDRHGIGLSISFLPNRVFIIDDAIGVMTDSGKWDFGRYFFKVGRWKVEKGELFIQPVAIYQIDRNYMASMGEKTELRSKYYPIWKVDLFESAAVQKTLFNYRRVPMRIRRRFRLIQDEFRRVRRLIPLSFDGFRDDLFTPEKPWFKFLMNPDLSDEQYVRNLKIMEYLGGGSGRRYDFARNVGKLDFSRWK